nr:DUF559 domain-containing protein [uncultured Sphingomonas sp.]
MQRTPPELCAIARQLRSDPTPAERRLWGVLREHRLRFTRQLLVSHDVIDIACRQLKLGIELDGGHHGDQIERDEARTAYLAAHGWTIRRFWNGDVLDDLDGVCAAILAAVAQAATHPRPLPCREGSDYASNSRISVRTAASISRS